MFPLGSSIHLIHMIHKCVASGAHFNSNLSSYFVTFYIVTQHQAACASICIPVSAKHAEIQPCFHKIWAEEVVTKWQNWHLLMNRQAHSGASLGSSAAMTNRHFMKTHRNITIWTRPVDIKQIDTSLFETSDVSFYRRWYPFIKERDNWQWQR